MWLPPWQAEALQAAVASGDAQVARLAGELAEAEAAAAAARAAQEARHEGADTALDR